MFIQCIRKNKPTKLKRESYKILPRPLAINEADFEIKIPSIKIKSESFIVCCDMKILYYFSEALNVTTFKKDLKIIMIY